MRDRVGDLASAAVALKASASIVYRLEVLSVIMSHARRISKQITTQSKDRQKPSTLSVSAMGDHAVSPEASHPCNTPPVFLTQT